MDYERMAEEREAEADRIEKWIGELKNHAGDGSKSDQHERNRRITLLEDMLYENQSTAHCFRQRAQVEKS